MKKNRIVIKDENTLQVFRKGITANKKIAAKNEKIVQTYTFSKEQFNYVAECVNLGIKTNFKHFFTLDKANCLDCPFSGNMRANDDKLLIGCYTHKLFQYSGFISMLKSIVNEFTSFKNIPTLDKHKKIEIVNLCDNLFVRFGSYGEPTKHDILLVKDICRFAKNWTGYTHQYFNKPLYKRYFMASVHNEYQAKAAKKNFNYRSFIAYDKNQDVNGVICPASNEADFKSNCSQCGICSGNLGKGTKDVKIIIH